MKRGVNRASFQEDLIKIIYSISDRNTVDDITQKLVSKRGFDRGLASDIMQGNAIYGSFDDVELGVVMSTIYEITSMPNARLERYLELAEINEVNEYKVMPATKKQKEQLFVFEDVRQVARDIWTVVVPAKRIVDLYRANKVKYNPETQRDPKLIKSGNTIISTINVNDSAVASIRDELIDGTFIPNTITFNVPMRQNSSVKYDNAANRLVVDGDKIDILDGYHRSEGLIAAFRHLNGKLNYNFELRITNFNVEKARRFIVQEDKRNSISKEYIKSIDTTDYISNIVNEINEGGKSEMRGQIVTDYELIKVGSGIVTFDLMHVIIKKLWTPESIIEAEDTADYLKDFFNRLIHSFTHDFKMGQLSSRDFPLNNEQSIAFYLILAKNMESNEEWKKELPKTLSRLNVKNGLSGKITKYNIKEMKRHVDRFISLSQEIIEEANNQ